MTADLLADPEGQALVARIHDRKRLTLELAAADALYTAAVSRAASLSGRPGEESAWLDARQAREALHQARAVGGAE